MSRKLPMIVGLAIALSVVPASPAFATAQIFFDSLSDPCKEGTCQVTIRDGSFGEGGSYTWTADFHRNAHASHIAETPPLGPGATYTYTFPYGDTGQHDIELRITGSGSTATADLYVEASVVYPSLVLESRSNPCIAGRCQVRIRDGSSNPDGAPYTWQADLHALRHASFVAETPPMPAGTAFTYTYPASDAGLQQAAIKVSRNVFSGGGPTVSVQPDLGAASFVRLARPKGRRCKITARFGFNFNGLGDPFVVKGGFFLEKNGAKVKKSEVEQPVSHSGPQTVSTTLSISGKNARQLRSGRYTARVEWDLVFPFWLGGVNNGPVVSTTQWYSDPMRIQRCRGNPSPVPVRDRVSELP